MICAADTVLAAGDVATRECVVPTNDPDVIGVGCAAFAYAAVHVGAYSSIKRLR
jgi:hypothetical protein